jgi:hypothetical protein
MFGDNKTVVDSATKIHGKLRKRHTALLFHRVREAMAAGFIGFHHIPGSPNPADVLTKHWLYACVWSMLDLYYLGKVIRQTSLDSDSTCSIYLFETN